MLAWLQLKYKRSPIRAAYGTLFIPSLAMRGQSKQGGCGVTQHLSSTLHHPVPKRDVVVHGLAHHLPELFDAHGGVDAD